MMQIEEIGRKAFHLSSVEVGPESAVLHIIWSPEPNVGKRDTIEYSYPKKFPGSDLGQYNEVIEALAQNCPLHMIGLERNSDGEYMLANARSVFGYVCPCQFE